jgi:hypothetical protein
MLQTPTPKLSASVHFYQQLGYEIIENADRTYASNGQLLIEINPHRHARAGIKLYQADWSAAIAELEPLTKITPIENGHLLGDGNGVWIYLMNGDAPINFTPKAESFGITGNYAGLSIESTDLERSLKIYTAIGFEKQSGDAEHGWLSLKHSNGLEISLMKAMMCPHLFFNPSLNFFNGKEGNPKCIEAIREANVFIAEEITHFNKEGKVDNLVLRDPGGLGFFIFND